MHDLLLNALTRIEVQHITIATLLFNAFQLLKLRNVESFNQPRNTTIPLSKLWLIISNIVNNLWLTQWPFRLARIQNRNTKMLVMSTLTTFDKLTQRY
jgi:hypothetical protein